MREISRIGRGVRIYCSRTTCGLCLGNSNILLYFLTKQIKSRAFLCLLQTFETFEETTDSTSRFWASKKISPQDNVEELLIETVRERDRTSCSCLNFSARRVPCANTSITRKRADYFRLVAPSHLVGSVYTFKRIYKGHARLVHHNCIFYRFFFLLSQEIHVSAEVGAHSPFNPRYTSSAKPVKPWSDGTRANANGLAHRSRLPDLRGHGRPERCRDGRQRVATPARRQWKEIERHHPQSYLQERPREGRNVFLLRQAHPQLWTRLEGELGRRSISSRLTLVRVSRKPSALYQSNLPITEVFKNVREGTGVTRQALESFLA